MSSPSSPADALHDRLGYHPPLDDLPPSTLSLETSTGGRTACSLPTRLNQALIRGLGGDAAVWDAELQATLARHCAGFWLVVPNLSATNETLLNGQAVTVPRRLQDGDVLAVGRESRGIARSPLTVRLSERFHCAADVVVLVDRRGEVGDAAEAFIRSLATPDRYLWWMDHGTLDGGDHACFMRSIRMRVVPIRTSETAPSETQDPPFVTGPYEVLAQLAAIPAEPPSAEPADPRTEIGRFLAKPALSARTWRPDPDAWRASAKRILVIFSSWAVPDFGSEYYSDFDGFFMGLGDVDTHSGDGIQSAVGRLYWDLVYTVRSHDLCNPEECDCVTEGF
jgi:hypothetical protein